MTQEKCPKCDGSGRFNDRPCRLCEGAGTVDEDVAGEYVFAYEKERLEAERDV